MAQHGDGLGGRGEGFAVYRQAIEASRFLARAVGVPVMDLLG